MRLLRVAVFSSVLAASVPLSSSASSMFASRSDVQRILRNDQFQVLRRAQQIPSEDLVWAGVLPAGQKSEAALANPGKPFDSSDAFVDASKLGHLIVAAINPRYEIICVWQATQGGPAAYFMLVRRAGRQSRVIFYASLNGEPRSWAEVKQLLFEGKISEFTSAEHPEPYRRG